MKHTTQMTNRMVPAKHQCTRQNNAVTAMQRKLLRLECARLSIKTRRWVTIDCGLSTAVYRST